VIALTQAFDNWIALGIAGLGVVYLFLVLIHPERF
jgi:hypothetical protein